MSCEFTKRKENRVYSGVIRRRKSEFVERTKQKKNYNNRRNRNRSECNPPSNLQYIMLKGIKQGFCKNVLFLLDIGS